MARLTYATPEDLPPDKRDLLETLSNADVDDADREHSLRGGSLNVYRAIGRNPMLLEAFREYASTAWAQAALSPHGREVVILTTAYYTDSVYEWQQHVRVALDTGMDAKQLLAISREEPDRLERPHAALVAYVEQFVDGRVDDATHERLANHYDDEIILGVGMLSGCYLGLARVLDALDVDLEAEFVGWDLENL